MDDPKIRLLVQRLRDKTRDGQIRWQESANPGEFQASFPGYTVGISQDSNLRVRVNVYNGLGSVIESILQNSWDDINIVLEELYELARRDAYQVDKALEELLGQLG